MPLDRDGPGALSRNERLILSLIRRRGPMPRAALAQLTGLSAQSITNLTRKLMMAGYLDAGAVVRGKVGQPSTPLALRQCSASAPVPKRGCTEFTPRWTPVGSKTSHSPIQKSNSWP